MQPFHRNVNGSNELSHILFEFPFSYLSPPVPPSLPSLLPLASPHPSSVYNPSPHPLARNSHWRSRYRLCALRRSRKSRMNRSQFLALPCFFPLTCQKKNTDNADIWTGMWCTTNNSTYNSLCRTFYLFTSAFAKRLRSWYCASFFQNPEKKLNQ